MPSKWSNVHFHGDASHGLLKMRAWAIRDQDVTFGLFGDDVQVKCNALADVVKETKVSSSILFFNVNAMSHNNVM